MGTDGHDAAFISGGQDPATQCIVIKQDGFGVVKTIDSRVRHNAEAAVDWLAGVVEHSVVIWELAQAEAGEALHRAVEN